MISERGSSTVIGYISLVVIVITASSLIIIAGASMIDTLAHQNQIAHAQQTLSQFSSEASLVALGGLDYREVDYGDTHNGYIELRENASTIEVSMKNESSTTHLIDEWKLGAVVYQNGDTEVAYEGGGIWQKQGELSQMVSPPEYHYQEQTLTFPAIRISGDSRSNGPTKLAIEEIDSSKVAEHNNPITDGEIHVTVESNYCEGWREFFLTRTGGSVSDCSNQSVTAQLVAPQEDSLSHGIAVEEGIDFPNSAASDFPDKTEANTDLLEIDSIVKNKINSAKDTNDNGGCIDVDSLRGGCTLTSGTYFVNDSANLNNDMKYDTSDGNIEIVINGDLDLTAQTLRNIDTDTTNNVTYYVNGDLELQQSTINSDSPNIESYRSLFLVTGGIATDSNSLANAEIDAVIYAPNADVSLNGNGNSVIRGAVYVNSLTMSGGGRSTIEYDEEGLDNFTLELDTEASTITYLHLSKNRIHVTAN